MKRIYKYPLVVDDVQDIKMAQGASVLCVQAQGETPCVWALVGHNSKMDGPSTVRRRFRTYGTGHPMDDAETFPHYVGTYQLRGGALVFHVFTDRVEYSA